MYSGELARLAGISTDTLRYYERRRLLPVAPRSASGYRPPGEQEGDPRPHDPRPRPWIGPPDRNGEHQLESHASQNLSSRIQLTTSWGHGESLVRIGLEAAAKGIGVRLKRDAVVAAARQEPQDIKLRESRYPKLAVLLDVDKLMEKEPVREGHVRHDHIAERDGGHLGEVRQAREAYARQHRVERRVPDTGAMQDRLPAPHRAPPAGSGRPLRTSALP